MPAIPTRGRRSSSGTLCSIFPEISPTVLAILLGPVCVKIWHAQSHPSSEESRPGTGRHYREGRTLPDAIVYQQLNGKAAVTICKRFTDLAGEPRTPEGILKLTDAQLRSVGLS